MIEVGDVVLTSTGKVHWTVSEIYSTGAVRLISGMTERIRFSWLKDLKLVRKADANQQV